jgi:uncharacterized membrane protein
MRTSLQTGLALVVGAGAMLLLHRGGRSPKRILAGARRLVSRKPVLDRTLELDARAKLESVTAHATAVHVAAEHGCVQLTGDVLTDERGQIVREVATVRGVDCVVDLMTEHRTADIPSLRGESPIPSPDRPAVLLQSSWPGAPRPLLSSLDLPPPARVAAAGLGLGIALLGLRLRGWLGLPLGLVGTLLLVVGSIRRRGPALGAPRGRASVAVAAMDVAAPVTDTFAALQALENLPQFVPRVQAVERLGATTYRLTIKTDRLETDQVVGEGGSTLVLDLEVVAVVHNRLLAWASAESSPVRLTAEARFDRVSGGGTRLRVRIDSRLPPGIPGQLLAACLGPDPSARLTDALGRIARLIEQGALNDAAAAYVPSPTDV